MNSIDKFELKIDIKIELMIENLALRDCNMKDICRADGNHLLIRICSKELHFSIAKSRTIDPDFSFITIPAVFNFPQPNQNSN